MTILGQHTIAEIKDLLRAKDYDIQKVDQAYADASPDWVSRDSNAFIDWTNDWNNLKSKYNAIRNSVMNSYNPIPDDVQPAEATYISILRALQPVPMTTTKGDLQDLYNRLIDATGKKVDLSATPQPTAPDADLNVYKAADTTLKSVAAAARAADNAVKPFIPSTNTLLLGGAGVLVGLVLLAKIVK